LEVSLGFYSGSFCFGVDWKMALMRLTVIDEIIN